MGIVKRLGRDGKLQYGVSRRLPPNKLGIKRFRRWYKKRAAAMNVLDQLSGAIATGTINDVLPGLVGAGESGYTVRTFWERFRDEYCKPRLPSWKRYELSFRSINAELGVIPLREFRRQHLHSYIRKREAEVSPGTINKDIAAIKKMFSFALEVGAVEMHPLVRFPTIKTQEVALQLPTAEEFRALVDAMPDPVVAALVAVMGETGMRKGEALNLTWGHVDFQGRRILVEKTKGKRVRSIPLSDYALEMLHSITRFVHQPYVFCHQEDGSRWVNPEKPFREGRKAAKLPWVSFHTLRHYRGTTWLQHGADIRTVKEGLGHRDIQTTMRYLKHVESYAEKSLREAQAREAESVKIQNKAGENRDE